MVSSNFSHQLISPHFAKYSEREYKLLLEIFIFFANPGAANERWEEGSEKICLQDTQIIL